MNSSLSPQFCCWVELENPSTKAWRGQPKDCLVGCLFVAVLGLATWGGILGAHKPANDVAFSVTVGIIYLVVTLVLGAIAEAMN